METALNISGITKTEQPTMALRWRRPMWGDLRLQQAWTITLYDEDGKPWSQETEWRDIPEEYIP